MKLFSLTALLALLCLSTGAAQAAEGDSCTTSTTLPGTEQGGICVAVTSPAYGTACASGLYYDGASCVALPTQTSAACSFNGSSSSTHYFNGSQCVVDNTSSGTCAAPSVWDKGQCVTPVAPVTPPTAPTGGLGSAAGTLPGVTRPGQAGGQQPICINSSTTVGMIVGSTICYGTAADLSQTNIYAYHTEHGTSQGGVVQTNSWNGIRLQDLYAEGNITARGQLQVYGGALLLSPDNKSGIAVVNNQVLSEAKDGAKVGKTIVTSTAVSSSVTDGTSTSSQVLNAGAVQTQVEHAAGLSKVLTNADGTLIQTQSGTGASPTAYSSIYSQANQITQRTADGARYTQSTVGVDNFQVASSNGAIQSQLNLSSSSIGLIAGAGGTQASNGTSGTTSGVGSGAFQVYQSAQTIAANTTINNALAGRTYQNQVNGNLFVDGNVYVNGTLEYVSSNAAVTTVASTAGTSILGANLTTSGSTSTVMRGTDAPHATVDGNGKISVVPGVSAQSSSALTLTNGLGNTHGFIVNETQATMSGGINSTSLTLNDNGATFSNSASGQPVQVHGVADGTADYDAVNVRQLEKVNRQLSAGVAGAVAAVNIPQVEPGKTFALGAGVGTFQGASALAIGSSLRLNPNTVVKATVSGVDSGSSRTTTLGMGIGVSW